MIQLFINLSNSITFDVHVTILNERKYLVLNKDVEFIMPTLLHVNYEELRDINHLFNSLSLMEKLNVNCLSLKHNCDTSK